MPHRGDSIHVNLSNAKYIKTTKCRCTIMIMNGRVHRNYFLCHYEFYYNFKVAYYISQVLQGGFHKHFLRTKLSLHTVSDLIFNSVTKFLILLSPTLTYQRQKSTFILSANQKPHITVPPPGFHAASPVRERVHAPGISQESSEKGGGQEDALQRLHHERLVSPPSTFHFFWPSYQTSITAFL